MFRCEKYRAEMTLSWVWGRCNWWGGEECLQCQICRWTKVWNEEKVSHFDFLSLCIRFGVRHRADLGRSFLVVVLPRSSARSILPLVQVGTVSLSFRQVEFPQIGFLLWQTKSQSVTSVELFVDLRSWRRHKICFYYLYSCYIWYYKWKYTCLFSLITQI